MQIFLLFLLVFCSICLTTSQFQCITPNGENGTCILFEQCEPFVNVWNDRTSKNIVFFRKSYCGHQDINPLVCCGSVAEFTQLSQESKLNNNSQLTTNEMTTIAQTIEMSRLTTNTAAIPTSSISTTETLLSSSSSTSHLFTSAIFTSEASTTSAITITSSEYVPYTTAPDSSRFKSHRNYNLLPVQGVCGVQTSQSKITGGTSTDIDEYPWLAMLLYKINNNVKPNCGGSLINVKYVLTAAHCIKANLVAVRLGEYNIEADVDCIIDEFGDEVCADPYQQFQIDNYVMHESYSNRDENRNNDIALIRLQQQAKLTDFVKPICLPLKNEQSRAGEFLIVAGWGLTENNISSSIKLAVNIPIWSNVSCTELYSIGYERNITSRQLCAGGQNGRDSCTGDSGGPLMRYFPNATEFYIEGIVSFGPHPCGRQATPGVYTRVSKYIDWILNNMKPF